MTGRRIAEAFGITPSASVGSAFWSICDCTGESGGTYQIIGSVRYSGCSGKATFQSTAIL